MVKTRNERNERRREGQSLSSILPKLRKMVFTIRTLTAEDFLSEKGQASGHHVHSENFELLMLAAHLENLHVARDEVPEVLPDEVELVHVRLAGPEGLTLHQLHKHAAYNHNSMICCFF